MFFSGGSDGAMHALKSGDRRAGMELDGQQTRPEHRRAPDRHRRHRQPQRREHRDERDGHAGGDAGRSRGPLTDKNATWLVRGVQAGYASPVSDGERIYVVDNGGVLFAFDVKTGKPLWQQKLGTIPKASPVLADGKLYIGTEKRRWAASSTSSGRMRIARRSSTRTGWGRRKNPNRSSRRRSLRADASTSTSMDAPVRYRTEDCARIKQIQRPAAKPAAPRARPARACGPAATLLVTPTELTIKPGESIALTAKAFDGSGNAVANPGAATWTLENLKGTVTDGQVHGGRRRRRAGRLGEGHGGIDQRRGAHSRDSRPAVDLRLRGRARNTAGALDQCHWTNSRSRESTAARFW